MGAGRILVGDGCARARMNGVVVVEGSYEVILVGEVDGVQHCEGRFIVDLSVHLGGGIEVRNLLAGEERSVERSSKVVRALEKEWTAFAGEPREVAEIDRQDLVFYIPEVRVDAPDEIQVVRNRRLKVEAGVRNHARVSGSSINVGEQLDRSICRRRRDLK